MPEKPLVSLIIPVYNHADLVKDAVSLAVRNAGIPKAQFEVVITDDNSKDRATIQLLKKLGKQYRVVHNSWKRGFPGNVNYGVAQENHTPYICLLNSDTRACTNWLKHLLATMEEDPQIGVVGAKLMYPKNHPASGGLIQHAGVARDATGNPYHVYRQATANIPAVNRRREINCVTFACALIRRDCWGEVGGLDTAYGLGNCEDVDFCWTARQKGWKVVYQPRAELYHWEHGSFGENLVAQAAPANFRRLREKWRHLDSDEYLFSPLNMTEVDSIEEFLYEIFHACRARSMAYVYDKPSKEHLAHCARLAGLRFQGLPEVERGFCTEWVDAVIRRLRDRQ